MLFKKGKLEQNIGKTKVVDYRGYKIFFEGLFFVFGCKQGEESIKKWIDVFIEKRTFPFENMYGNFFVLIENLASSECYAFSDNSGLYKAYYNEECISTSFLELIDNVNFSENDLNHDAIVEFLHFGFSYFDRTFLNSVNELDARNYYHYKDGQLTNCSKGITEIYETTGGVVSLDEYFEALTYAVSDSKVSLDLTGGFDSRLILSYFYKFKSSFETAISGIKGNKDIKIAEHLSSIVNKNFYPTYHTASDLDYENMYSIFKHTDGQMDILDFHRNNQFFNDRKSRDIDLSISGAGGELYKDFWWLQDFPRYNKKAANLDKLYDLRIGGKSFPHSILGEKLIDKSQKLKSKTLSELSELVLETNTQTYDNIYFEYKMKTNAGNYISSSNNYIMAYAPLLEKNIVRLGYQLERKERFFNFFHKKIITNNARAISGVRTTEYISCSSKPLNVLLDVFFYAFDKFIRATKVIVRKFFNVVTFQESPTNQDVVLKVKSTDGFKENVEFLKSKGILNPTIEMSSIPNNMVGRIITLSYFYKSIK